MKSISTHLDFFFFLPIIEFFTGSLVLVGLGVFFNNLLLNEKFGNFWEMGKLVFYNWILVALGNTPLVLSPKIFPQGDKQDEAKCQAGSWAVLSLKPRSKSTPVGVLGFSRGLALLSVPSGAPLRAPLLHPLLQNPVLVEGARISWKRRPRPRFSEAPRLRFLPAPPFGRDSVPSPLP